MLPFDVTPPYLDIISLVISTTMRIALNFTFYVMAYITFRQASPPPTSQNPTFELFESFETANSSYWKPMVSFEVKESRSFFLYRSVVFPDFSGPQIRT